MNVTTLFGLANNWSVLADPFYAMKEREGYKLSVVKNLTPKEAIRAVLGDALADRVIKNGKIEAANSTQQALFAAFCYLRLRQKGTLEFPIGLDENFYFADPTRGKLHIAGLEVLKQYGRYVNTPKCLGTAFTQFRNFKDNIVDTFVASHKLEPWAVRQALLTGVIASQDGVNFKVLTYAACRPVIEKMFGNLPNVVYVDPNWIRVFDFNATAQDVATVIDWLAGALSKGGVSPIEVTEAEDGFSVWMDSYEFRVTLNDGVFEKGRNLRFNNMLMVTSLTGRASGSRVQAQDLSLINSYGTFLYGLLMLGSTYLAPSVPELGQLVSKKLLVELPCTSDDEARAFDSDRASYDRYVTVTRMSAIDLPIGFARYQLNDEWYTKLTYNRDISVSALGDIVVDYAGGSKTNTGVIKGAQLPAKSSVDAAALLGFNLVRMPRGQFIDGRRSCIQAKHVPAELREQFVRDVLSGMVGENSDAAIAQYCRDTFSMTGNDDEVIKGASNHLIIGLSSKLAKLIKRTAMDAACVGQFTKSGGRGLKRYSQKGQSNNNWLVEAVVSPHAIFPAGMAAYWGEEPQMIVKHTQSVQPCVPGLNNLENAVIPLFKGGERADRFGWYVLRYKNPIRLDDLEPVADIPYVIADEPFRHTIVNNVADGRLVEIRWRATKVQGNNTTLQVVVVTQTHETQIKGRNNVKCMLSRYTPDVVINELNPELNARSVFFADTNKWLDLVMSLVDVASCTAVQNQDAEGLRLVAEANALVNSKAIDYLEWSPVIAVLGHYQPLINWFEAKYGRAVWFRHADATSEWTTILRRMYEGAKGWSVVEPESVGYAIPAGATDVLVLTDGSVANDRDNVLVFYTLEGVSYFVQRAWSYAGTSTTGAVWQPVKGELSSVRASVGNTPLMAGVARAVEHEDKEYATRLVQDGFKQVHKSAVFFAMAKNQTIKAKGGAELPLYMLGDANASALLQTEELKAIVSKPENAGELLRLLAPRFKNVMFSICCGARGHFSVYLPAVLMQDSAAGFKSVDGLSDLITRLFVLYIQGVASNDKEFLQLAGRAKGALSKLTDSAGLIKSGAFCRMAMQAKTQALPGIPLNEVWVRSSARDTSAFATMKRVFDC